MLKSKQEIIRDPKTGRILGTTPSMIISKEELYDLYWNHDNTTREVARILGKSQCFIRYWMKKHDIAPKKNDMQETSKKWTLRPILAPSNNLAYILGVLKGDGCVYRTKIGYGVVLSVVDKLFAESFKENLTKIGLHPKISLRDKGNPRWKKQFAVLAYSKAFYYWYKNLTLEDIENLLVENKEFIREFIRGFYESEGCFSYWRKGMMYTLEIGVTDQELLKLVQRMARCLGFDFKMDARKQKKSKTFYRLRMRGRYKAKFKSFFNTIKPCIKEWGRLPVLYS